MRRRCLVWAAVALAWCPATALAQETTTYEYIGMEETYVVPPGYSYLHVRAIGGPGGGAAQPPTQVAFPPWPQFPDQAKQGGRGAIVEGDVPVTPGQVLYVLVGGSGGLPDGGFNGGGQGGQREFWMFWGGGGASDLRTLSSSQGDASLASRLIVAAGGGGSAWIAAWGGAAGEPGGCCGARGLAPESAQPGTQTAGGAGGGGCGDGPGCGEPGSFGAGGAGGVSEPVPGFQVGAGGGGGWYGGGGGTGHPNNVGGGAGGSSKRPGGATFALASRTTPPQVEITPVAPPRTACADGTDNDLDGLVDLQADPGCASSRDEDESNPDTFSPDARLSGPRKQRIGRSVAVELSCLATVEDCIVSATGTVVIGRAGRVYSLKRIRSLVVLRRRKLTLRLGIPRGTHTAATSALRTRGRAYAKVNVRVTDEVGNVREMTRRIRLAR